MITGFTVGIAMVALLFIAIFFVFWMDFGFVKAVTSFLFTGLIMAWVLLSACLIDGTITIG